MLSERKENNSGTHDLNHQFQYELYRLNFCWYNLYWIFSHIRRDGIRYDLTINAGDPGWFIRNFTGVDALFSNKPVVIHARKVSHYQIFSHETETGILSFYFSVFLFFLFGRYAWGVYYTGKYNNRNVFPPNFCRCLYGRIWKPVPDEDARSRFWCCEPDMTENSI